MSLMSVAELQRDPDPALSEVGRGGTVLITRDGEAVALLTSPPTAPPSGRDVMAMLRETPVDPEWAQERW